MSFLTTGIRATVSQSVYVKERKLGHYVAQYAVTDLQIQQLSASSTFASSSNETTALTMFDRQWQIKVTSQPEPMFYFGDDEGEFFNRVTVEVFDEQDRSVALLQTLQAKSDE